jgi:hypothetical protein
MADESVREKRQRREVPAEQEFDRCRVGGTERAPRPAPEVELTVSDRRLALEERGKRSGREAAEAAVHAHEPDRARLEPAEAVEDLCQLELVEEIGLEPEQDLAPLRLAREAPVPPLELRAHALVTSGFRFTEEASAHPAQGDLVETGRHGSFVQELAPGEHSARNCRPPQPSRRRVAVRDV